MVIVFEYVAIDSSSKGVDICDVVDAAESDDDICSSLVEISSVVVEIGAGLLSMELDEVGAARVVYGISVELVGEIAEELLEKENQSLLPVSTTDELMDSKPRLDRERL